MVKSLWIGRLIHSIPTVVNPEKFCSLKEEEEEEEEAESTCG